MAKKKEPLTKKYKVIHRFKDKYTMQEYKIGDEYEATSKRAKELIGYIEEIEDLSTDE